MTNAAPRVAAPTAPLHLPHDPALPALATLLPAAGLPELVRGFAEEAGGARVDGQAVYVRYRPGRSCVVLYELAHPEGGSLHVYARHQARGRGARRLERPAFQQVALRLERERGSRALLHLADAGVLLHAFPLDPRLPALADADTPEWVESRLAPRLGLAGARLRSHRPLSYKPERRCVFHYRLAPRGGGEAAFFAKLFRDARGAAMLPTLRSLAAQLRTAAAPWDVVAPAGHLAEAGLLAFPAVSDGLPASRALREALEDGSELPSLLEQVERAARGLSAFQRARLPDLPARGPRALLSALERAAASTAGVAPELAAACRRRLVRLADAAAALEPEPLVPAHGAFRHGQLLLCPQALVVLDLDTLALSGASADAGNFLAYLDFTGLRRPRLRPVLARCREVFLRALPPSAGAGSPWLAWHRAAAQVKIALRSFLSLSPRWPEHVPALLAAADAALDGLPTGTAPC
jgi:hypothetical protein